MTDAAPNNMTALEQFRKDFAVFWQKMPGIGWFLLLSTVWTCLFLFLGNATLGYINSRSLFGWMDWVCSRPESPDSHIPLLSLVILGLAWWKREELMNTPKQAWWPAIGIVLLGMGLHVLGFSAFQECRISLVGFFVGLYGLMGVVWGPRFLKASFFPVLLFCFFLPIGGTLGEKVTFPLRLLATKITAIISQSLGINVIQHGTMIFDSNGTYQYEVAAACSGIRSLTVTLLIAVGYSFVSLKRWWKRGVMISAAFPLAVAANVIRLLTIIIAAESLGQEAGKKVHDSSWMSMVPYIPMFVGVFGLGHWLKKKEPGSKAADQGQEVAQWELSDLKVPLAIGALGACVYYLAPDLGKWIEEHPFTMGSLATIALVIWLTGPAVWKPSSDAAVSYRRLAFAGGAALFVLILGLQVGTAGFLTYRQASQKLGVPGVKVVSQPVYGEKGEVVSTNRVELPATVLNYESTLQPIQKVVVEWLPKDTTYGQRLYKAPDGFEAQMNVVLMGTDRTSIHKPQYCLTGQGWRIEKSELISIEINEPTPYKIPAMKLTASHDWTDPTTGRKGIVRGVYVYWFVSEDQLSADHDQRMLWMGLDMLRTGILKRWAYVSCFSVCHPGQEEMVYGRMKELVAASVPHFQSVNNPARLARAE